MYFPQTGFHPSQPANGKDEATDAACVCASATFSVWQAIYIHIVCTRVRVPLENTFLWTWPQGIVAVSSVLGYQMQQLLTQTYLNLYYSITLQLHVARETKFPH